MAQRRLAIVLGYLAGDELPGDARRLGLVHRVAFALDSFEQTADDGSTFDADLAGAPLAAPYHDRYAIPVFTRLAA